MTREPGRKVLEEEPKRRGGTGRHWWTVWRVLRAALVGYLLVILVMMIFEEYLIFPAPQYPNGDWQPASINYRDEPFDSADGTKLHGWYVEHTDPKAYVLYCHGNGEHVASLTGLLEKFHDDFQVSTFAFDYRGYGRSEGSPREKGVFEDGRAAQAWLAREAGIQLSDVVIIGFSIGGAVAVDAAAANGARGLVLERTFTTLPDVAARHYPWLPVRLLMRTQMDSESKIVRYNGPLLQSHGSADPVVPLQVGKRLFDAAASDNKQFFIEQDVGHNEPHSEEYWQRLRQFLWELPP